MINKIISNNKLPSFKRNLGVKHSKNNFLIFTDDDAYLDNDYLKYAENIFKRLFMFWWSQTL